MEKLLAFAFLMVALPSSGVVGEPIPQVQVPSHSVRKLSQANSDFALRLYKRIVALQDSASQNIFFSPLSISAAMSTLSLGAQENTLSQILQVLGYSNITNNDATLLGEIFNELLDDMRSKINGTKMGRYLFIQDGLILHERFLREARKFYDVSAKSIDFQDQKSAQDRVNSYVNKKTEGKISNLLLDPFSPDTLMLHLEYFLVKEEWLKPFNPTKTYETDFYVNSSTTVKVQMMNRQGIYHMTYAEDLSSQVLLMESSGNTSLMILLPASGKMAELEQKLTAERYSQLLKSLEKQPVDVHLPRMMLSADYKLKGVLSSMGIEDAFNSNANLSRISEKRIKLSQVIQKAVLEVDEKGPIGAEGSATELLPEVAAEKFRCNRPFLLLIIEKYINSILFAGKVMNPTA